jgi:hypothetical protein
MASPFWIAIEEGVIEDNKKRTVRWTSNEEEETELDGSQVTLVTTVMKEKAQQWKTQLSRIHHNRHIWLPSSSR